MRTLEAIIANTPPADFTAASYTEWCARFVERHVHVRGLCALAAAQVALAFPELRVVRGFCRGCQHWWAVAPDGSIVDPTASQFGAPAPRDYVPFDESRAHELPTGKCMNCGGLLWYNASACTLECARELHLEFNPHLEDAELERVIRGTRLNPVDDPARPCFFPPDEF